MNHLIQTSDLKKSQGRDLVAKYLRMNVVPGELIKKDDVASVPLLGTDSYPWFAVQTPAEAAHKDVDPKSKGQICDEGTALSPAEVVALFCNGGQQDNFCVVLVRVAPTDATKLSAVLSAKPSPGNLLFKPACGKDHK
ncbi:hypothetical protein SAMN04487926_11617 [Paraburkholderia steynii]|uniref:Uncharacterized protein n=2 Tax=Paraburkholderia steynii TaxID=1245441 RepID=A0A7Z7BA78_9BURK|nr:hypothetical protein SAMN04487926_11617 [Paraburkholderia steynii]